MDGNMVILIMSMIKVERHLLKGNEVRIKPFTSKRVHYKGCRL